MIKYKEGKYKIKFEDEGQFYDLMGCDLFSPPIMRLPDIFFNESYVYYFAKDTDGKEWVFVVPEDKSHDIRGNVLYLSDSAIKVTPEESRKPAFIANLYNLGKRGDTYKEK